MPLVLLVDCDGWGPGAKLQDVGKVIEVSESVPVGRIDTGALVEVLCET